jgi:Protein of unknown function (DUF3309)
VAEPLGRLRFRALDVNLRGRTEAGGNRTSGFDSGKKEKNMLGTILIVILVMALLGVLPRWSHSREWGYAPTGGVGLILVIVVILLLLGRI